MDTSRQVIDENFDDYRLVDFELLTSNLKVLHSILYVILILLQDLLENKQTKLPLYDFRKSGRYAYKTVSPPESKVVVVEGIYALHEMIQPYLDLRVLINAFNHLKPDY